MGNELQEAINWWENELDSDDRNKIMKNKGWSDIGENNPEGIKKRHAWLILQYKKYHNIYPKK